MDKEIKITPPEGYEIDKENSTFEVIKFIKKEQNAWRYDNNQPITGYIISKISNILNINQAHAYTNIKSNYNVFATEKQVKSALAMARISQIIANDKRFGGAFTDEAWNNNTIFKYVIVRNCNNIETSTYSVSYTFLAFHTAEQRDLFLKENEDLVKDYLMID